MMLKGLKADTGIYGGLLAASLALAWWASTPKTATEARQVRVATIDIARIQEVSWAGALQKMTARRREGDGRFWIQYGKEEFLAGRQFDEALATFSPLEAKRVADVAGLSDEQWQAFGLKPSPAGKLTFTFGPSETWTLEVGSPAFGTTDRYALSPDGTSILLMDGDALSGFDNALARFFDRAVLSSKIDEADGAELEKGSQKKRFSRPESRSRGRDKAPFEGPFNDWLEKFERLRAIRYADPATEEKLAREEPQLVLKILDGDKIAEELVVKKIAGTDTANGPVTWWVFSSDARAHLEISANRAEPVVKDADSLL